MKNRNEIPSELKWDLSQIFKSDAAWEKALAEAQAEIADVAALAGTLTESAATLKAALDKIYALGEKIELIYLYANLYKCTDNGNPAYQAMESKAMSLYVSYSMAVSFVDPEILATDEEKLKSLIDDPALKEYRHILLDTNRARPHTLDAKTEQILAMLGEAAQTPSNAFEMLEAVDMTFPDTTGEDGKPAPLSHGAYRVFLESENPGVRKEAYEKYFGEFKKYINTIAALYGGSVKQDTFFSRVKNFPSSCEAALFGSNVPLSVYDSLVEAIHDGLPTMKEYIKTRKKLLGLDEVHMYDLYCPMMKSVDMKTTYDEAKELVKKACAPLGEEYVSLLERAYNERWVDVYETPGKTTGAFSCGVYGVHPYVLLNFSGTLDDAFTLAHELGHSMHSYFSSRENSYANHDYKIFCAEVASTVNEVLLVKYLLSVENDKDRRAALLNHLLESFRTTVFRQTLFAEFERKAHEMDESGEPLTPESLNKVYRELNLLYYDGAVVDGIHDTEWARIPHFYNAFYVYQYATGFCSAVKIANDILSTGDASNYLKFLSTGGSDYPIEELKIAGVDLTKPETVRSSLKVFDDTLREFKELVGA
ncbi:MAG: oligoendopeptidase F [Clostridia bacterium]|nr:oligoendopeptidase F [Clostridia bacterium]MBO4429585.1 oligoendopeptidase F [Clostridia bacterium]